MSEYLLEMKIFQKLSQVCKRWIKLILQFALEKLCVLREKMVAVNLPGKNYLRRLYTR